MPASKQPQRPSPTSWRIAKKQLAAISFFLILLGVLMAILYLNDRAREWRLREEQAAHRLELAFELISRDLHRVRSDVLYVANQEAVKFFDPAERKSCATILREFENLVEFKQTYQQVRLIETNGLETIRVDLVDGMSRVIETHLLQDKSDRYYFREALTLKPGEIFVSEFDLNQEHGQLEQPLNPVIRFVTPVVDEQEQIRFLLVANYRGGPLLDELANISLPGETFLMRADGQYLLAPDRRDAWGWLLNHKRSFASQFPDAWKEVDHRDSLWFQPGEGAFAVRKIQLTGRTNVEAMSKSIIGSSIFLVSHLPAASVFQTSNQLLHRLLGLGSVLLLPLFLLTRLWTVASARRQQQALLIRQSEKKLRELSGRLVKIQEDERRAISREIHDQLGQQATAINLDLKLARRESNLEAAGQQLERAIGESESLLEALHNFASRVRPVELDDLGLHDAVESHLQQFRQRARIEFAFVSNIEQVEVSIVVSENVFRLIQESLNNVLRHANATRVDVAIRSTCDADGHQLKVCVKDDGVGLSNGEILSALDDRSIEGSPRLGILGMRERVELLGGSLCFTSHPDDGTTIEAIIPIHDFIENSTESAS